MNFAELWHWLRTEGWLAARSVLFARNRQMLAFTLSLVLDAALFLGIARILIAYGFTGHTSGLAAFLFCLLVAPQIRHLMDTLFRNGGQDG